MKYVFLPVILVFLFLNTSIPTHAEETITPIPLVNPDGMKLEETYYTSQMTPYNFVYNFDTKFYRADGEFLGWMQHLAEDDALRRYGRTFAHPSTAYKWGEAMGGNPTFVRDNLVNTLLERDKDGKMFSRVHSLKLGQLSGAHVIPKYFKDGGLSHVVVTPTPYPTGTFHTPVKVNQNQNFDLTLNAEEYNPHESYIRYEVWVDSYYKVFEGEVNQDDISNIKIPLNFSTAGDRWIQVRLTDSVNRRTNVYRDITVNAPPVANFSMNPTPTDRLKTVQITDASTDPENDALTYKYEYKLKQDSTWKTLSTVANPSFIFPSVGTYEVKETVTDTNNASDSVIKEIVVENIGPQADFTATPNPTDRLSTVQITSKAIDPENDDLDYVYEYRVKGQTTWNHISSGENTTFTFPSIETYEVRQTVTDPYNDSDSIVKEVLVENIGPTADFTALPNPTNRLETVQFTSQATDPDNDALIYNYEYREKGNVTWTALGNESNPTFVFPKVATYEVRQTVTDAYNAADSIIKEVIVENIGPVADFNWNPSVVYKETSVSFTNASTDADNDTLTYQWAYQEPGSTTWNNFSTATNPSATFNKKGKWNVRLSVSDGSLTDSITKAILVGNRAPVANFSWNPATIYNDTAVKLTNSASDIDNDSLTYQWAYQEPNSTTWVNFSTQANPTKVFAIKGTWNVRLTVSDGSLTHSATKSLTVGNRAPVANFDWNPTTIYNDTNVLMGNTSSDVDNDALTYQWAYQKPNSSTWVNFSTNMNPIKIFDEKGIWKIRLNVSDGTATDSTAKSLTVGNRKPVPNFSWSPDTIYNDSTVTFSNVSTDADKDSLTYQWAYSAPNSSTWTNFSTAKNPSKLFDQKGDWQVRLTVHDGAAYSSITKTVTVGNRAPISDFTWNPTTIYNDVSVTFSNEASDIDGDSLTYQWAYQEPNSSTWTNFSTSTNPSKVLNVKGTWKIRLTVSDGKATHAVAKELIVKNRAPVSNFSWNPTTIYKDTNVTLTNSASDVDKDNLTYQWAYQEPNSTTWINFSSEANPTKVFAEKGAWNVRLTVSDGSLTHSITKTLTVRNRAPVANFNWNPTTIYIDTTVTMKNISSDIDNDSLTYQWAYQEPGSTTWTNFSTSTNPANVFDKKGTWKIRLVANDGTLTHTVTKPLIVLNRAPVADFNWNPATIYTDTNLKFTQDATDADKDSLTFKWEYQAPGSTTWVNFSTAPNPSQVFNEKGKWNIKLTVNDGTETDSIVKTITISNRAPIAAFDWNPTTIFTDTVVTFSNKSVDPDQDDLTYQWAYQTPDSTTWKNFSTDKYPSETFGQKGKWQIRLIASDGEVTTSLTKELLVSNTPPKVSLTYSPNNVFEGDTVTLKAIPTDLDGDKMTVILEENRNGVWKEIQKVENTLTNTAVTHSFVANSETYQIRAKVIDDNNGVGTDVVNFVVTPLEIQGIVNHTVDWEAIHEEAGHQPNQFYSGERFLTEAVVTDHPIEKVTVSFAGNQITGNLLTLLLPMTERTHPVYEVEVYEKITGNPDEHLAPGMAYFVFEAKWENGVVKQDKVAVNIVSDVYGAFDFYRSN